MFFDLDWPTNASSPLSASAELLVVSRDSELDQNLTGDLRKNFSSDLNEIRYVGRGRWVMHDDMPYDRNQGQGQGHSREVDRQSPTGLIFSGDAFTYSDLGCFLISTLKVFWRLQPTAAGQSDRYSDRDAWISVHTAHVAQQCLHANCVQMIHSEAKAT